MATIEKRAKRLRGTCKFLNDKFRDGYEKGLHDGCFMGAHLQKKIDIDKACEWLYKNILCMQHDTKTMFLARFRKAMEE